MVQPNVSTLDLLKAQRARKAAAKMAEESVTEDESETENQLKENPPPISENPLPTSDDPLLVSSDRLSWDFADEAAVPPGLRRKDVARNDAHSSTAQHNPPIRSEKTRSSTPPTALSSAAGGGPSSSSEPLLQRAPLASQQQKQQLRVRQILSTQTRHSSPVGKSRRLQKSAN